ncbi:hypothetical protein EG329_009062 [Mollisiaceae sp. DMI_Dod_QoI]|nr:hypothetical protein EG329_009062 [Helotiales sp. DMI_Dod_QoI]
MDLLKSILRIAKRPRSESISSDQKPKQIQQQNDVKTRRKTGKAAKINNTGPGAIISIRRRLQQVTAGPVPTFPILLVKVHTILQTKNPISEDRIRLIVPYIASPFNNNLKAPPTVDDIEEYVKAALAQPRKEVFTRAIFDNLTQRMLKETTQHAVDLASRYNPPRLSLAQEHEIKEDGDQNINSTSSAPPLAAAMRLKEVQLLFPFSQNDVDAVKKLMEVETHHMGARPSTLVTPYKCHLCRGFKTDSVRWFITHMLENHHLLLTEQVAKKHFIGQASIPNPSGTVNFKSTSTRPYTELFNMKFATFVFFVAPCSLAIAAPTLQTREQSIARAQAFNETLDPRQLPPCKWGNLNIEGQCICASGCVDYLRICDDPFGRCHHRPSGQADTVRNGASLSAAAIVVIVAAGLL